MRCRRSRLCQRGGDATPLKDDAPRKLLGKATEKGRPTTHLLQGRRRQLGGGAAGHQCSHEASDNAWHERSAKPHSANKSLCVSAASVNHELESSGRMDRRLSPHTRSAIGFLTLAEGGCEIKRSPPTAPAPRARLGPHGQICPTAEPKLQPGAPSTKNEQTNLAESPQVEKDAAKGFA